MFDNYIFRHTETHVRVCVCVCIVIRFASTIFYHTAIRCSYVCLFIIIVVISSYFFVVVLFYLFVLLTADSAGDRFAARALSEIQILLITLIVFGVFQTPQSILNTSSMQFLTASNVVPLRIYSHRTVLFLLFRRRSTVRIRLDESYEIRSSCTKSRVARTHSILFRCCQFNSIESVFFRLKHKRYLRRREEKQHGNDKQT